MNKRQRQFNAAIDELVEICRLRGIGPQQLRIPLGDVCTSGATDGSQFYFQELRRVEELTAAGLSAQLSFLLKALGITKLKKFLENTGGILDAIVRHTSSSSQQLNEDTGRDKIDADGHVV